jgi:hypothetical protein
MKRFIPFYTWVRKNIPLQISEMVQQPMKFGRLAKFHQDIGPMVLGDPSETTTQRMLKPEYMRKMKYVPTRWTDNQGNKIYVHLDLPTEDLSKMWELQNWLGQLTPLMSLYEVAANVRTWPKGDMLQQYPGQRVAAPFWTAWMGETMGSFADIGPMIHYRTGKQVAGMNPRWRYALENAFPFLNEWSRMFPQPGTLGIGSDETSHRALSYATGIKVKAVDVQKEARRKYFKVREARKAAPKILRARGGQVSREDLMGFLDEILE